MKKRHEELLILAIDAYCEKGNTPEEFGSLLCTATQPFYTTFSVTSELAKRYNEERHTARIQIANLIGFVKARELLNFEEG